jgi:hypothetical protein
MFVHNADVMSNESVLLLSRMHVIVGPLAMITVLSECRNTDVAVLVKSVFTKLPERVN